jgi:hypothetical protein
MLRHSAGSSPLSDARASSPSVAAAGTCTLVALVLMALRGRRSKPGGQCYRGIGKPTPWLTAGASASRSAGTPGEERQDAVLDEIRNARHRARLRLGALGRRQEQLQLIHVPAP